MRHLVGYHNTEKMGYSIEPGNHNRFGFLTSKRLAEVGDVVWEISGSGKTPKKYSLSSWFIVDEISDLTADKFKLWIKGNKGGSFISPLELNCLSWFPEFFKRVAHFSIGLQVIKQTEVVAAFLNAAAAEGWSDLFEEMPVNEVPSAEAYAMAFRDVRNLTDSHRQMLRIHYHSPEHTITATALSNAMGHDHHIYANGQYGRLGRMIGDALRFDPSLDHIGTLVNIDKRNGEWHWILRPEVALALETLGWVEGTEILLPEEIEATGSFIEGAISRVSINTYERNREARQKCLHHHGMNCCICNFNFGVTYGEIAKDYIHVHHLRALSDIGESYEVNPIEDLRPVCPNCHAVLHRRIPAFSIEEVKQLLKLADKDRTRRRGND